jgi:transcriptional regulator GlxA family with amidase domain
VCGHFEYDRSALHPFFRTLPKLIHVETDENEKASWLMTAARLAAAESSSGQRVASAVVDRLAEALLMQTLELYLAQSEEPHGFLAAVSDVRIGRALSSMHGAPERTWTLRELARIAGLSRSGFSERFRALVGQSPMRYLSDWRMLRARVLLEEGSLSTADVASRSGYQSEFAFARAFKRHFGRGPGASRRLA